jgi:hypothetical protein
MKHPENVPEMSVVYGSVELITKGKLMPLMTIPESKIWFCDNGCGESFDPASELLTQMSSPDGRYLVMVCPTCVFDEEFEDWAVDFDPDPR